MTDIAPHPPYRVRRSARARRARLTLTDDGEALVVLPERAAESIAQALVTLHAGWLARHQQRIRAESHALASRPPLGGGRPLMVHGVEHQLSVVPIGTARSTVRLSAGPSPAIAVGLAGGSSQSVAEVVGRWLRGIARGEIESAVARRSAEMGVSPSSIAIRDQRTRWASASARGSLSFSWRLVMCPPAVLDYVVVHELAHLRWRGHGPRFWEMVQRHVPEADAHRRWLRANRRAVQAALD